LGEESKADDASPSLLKTAGVEMGKKSWEKKKKRKRKRKAPINDSGLRKSSFPTLIISHYYYLVCQPTPSDDSVACCLLT
jgi:hypothetical protein